EALVPGDRPAAQLEPNARPGVVLRRLVGGRRNRHQRHHVELQLDQRLLGQDQMAEVGWVEGAAEDPDPGHRTGAQGRTWPEPSTTYLYVQSSRIPMGPRAWSFWVELPISAPMPNSKPSV